MLMNIKNAELKAELLAREICADDDIVGIAMMLLEVAGDMLACGESRQTAEECIYEAKQLLNELPIK
jgi:hypothetical protein